MAQPSETPILPRSGTKSTPREGFGVGSDLQTTPQAAKTPFDSVI